MWNSWLEKDQPSWNDDIPEWVSDAIAKTFACVVRSACRENTTTVDGADKTKSADLYFEKRWLEVPGRKDDFRCGVTFRVFPMLGEIFFNGPEGLRGHYYRGAEAGNNFTKRCIGECMADLVETFVREKRKLRAVIEREASNKSNTLNARVLDRVFEDSAWRRRLEVSLEQAKIWYKETPRVAPFLVGTHFVKNEDRSRFRWTKERNRSGGPNLPALQRALREQVPGLAEAAYRAIAGNTETLGMGAQAFAVTRLDIKSSFHDVDLNPWWQNRKHPVVRGLTIHHLGFS